MQGMRNDSEILKYFDLIREGARRVAHSPFEGSALVKASSWVEASGMPDSYRLHATACKYAVFDNSEQLAVTLAARVGNPRVSPVPPLWPLLALLLLAWRDILAAERVLVRAATLGMEDEVHRGLAVIAYLFPELEKWLAAVQLRIPTWEKNLAVPLAARKLVLLDAEIVAGGGESRHDDHPAQWRVTGASRRGNAHVRSSLQNQDAIEYWI